MKCVDPNQSRFYRMESWGETHYQEITEPEKIVYADDFPDAEGNENNARPSSQATLQLTDCDGTTKLISRSEYGSAGAPKTVKYMGIRQGITETWE